MKFKKAAEEVDPKIGTWHYHFDKKTGTLTCSSNVTNPDFEAIRGTITEVLTYILQTKGIKFTKMEVQMSNVPIDQVMEFEKQLSEEVLPEEEVAPPVRKVEKEQEVDTGDEGNFGPLKTEKHMQTGLR